MLLSAAACRWNAGRLPCPRYAATAWRRSVSIIDEPYFEACIAHWSGMVEALASAKARGLIPAT
jgi:hypothetical protein